MDHRDHFRRDPARLAVRCLINAMASWAAPCVIAVAFAWLNAPAAYAAGTTRNVLLLFSASRLLPANIERERGLRHVLEGAPDLHIELYAEFLDVPRFEGESYVRTVADFLRDKYSMHPPDVIVVGGDSALAFLLSHRALIFPDTPVVHSGITTTFLQSHPPLPDDVVGTPVEYDTVRTIDLAFQLRPSATRLVFVTGTDSWSRMWEARLRSDLPRFPSQAKTEFVSGLSTDAVRKRLAELGNDTVVYTPGYFEDGDGKVSTPVESVKLMAAASAAPIYGPLNPFVGAGAVGGYVTSFEAMGQQAGRAVKALLEGASPASLRSSEFMPVTLTVDWRELRRWGLVGKVIPSDAVVLFREPTLVEAHPTAVSIAAMVFLTQAALIVGLLFERRRRRTAEAQAQARLSEMAHMNRRVAMGGLAASIAHELNQPLGAIYNNAGAARMLIKADPPKLEEITEILEDIQLDDKRASDVISRIRKMLSKANIEMGDLDLNEAIGEAMKMLAADAAARGMSLKTELAPGLPKVHADRVQIQQVILNLAINAMEAMHDQPEATRVLVVRSARADDKSAEVSVADSGVGIPTEILSRIFNPFVTSKPSGMGLGLSISRTIVEAHGGRIRAENLPAGGAAFHFTVPFATAKRS
jgi:signal transduction histidine kinase